MTDTTVPDETDEEAHRRIMTAILIRRAIIGGVAIIVAIGGCAYCKVTKKGIFAEKNDE